MLDKSKTDPELGRKIKEELEKRHVQTPSVIAINNLTRVSLTDQAKIDRIETYFLSIMKTLGLDIEDDSLKETPKRVAKMYVREIFWGLSFDNFPKITTIQNKMLYDEMLVENGISVNSNCEHHFVAIQGKCTIGYIPRNKVVGLSKLNRIVEFFSKRPQVQERLTEQIFWTLQYILETKDIAVVIKAKHFCVVSRGVEDERALTTTSKMGGAFRDPKNPNARREFLDYHNTSFLG